MMESKILRTNKVGRGWDVGWDVGGTWVGRGPTTSHHTLTKDSSFADVRTLITSLQMIECHRLLKHMVGLRWDVDPRKILERLETYEILGTSRSLTRDNPVQPRGR